MKISKTLSIIAKSPVPDDLKAIADLFDAEFHIDQEKNPEQKLHYTLDFEVVDSDGTTYNFSHLKDLVDGQYLKRIGLANVRFRYTNYSDDKGIEFIFRYPSKEPRGSNYDSINSVQISGMDEKWVKGTAMQIDEIISHWPPRMPELAATGLQSSVTNPKRSERKKIPIKGKVIRKSNVMGLASMIWSEYKKDTTSAKGTPTFNLVLTEDDETTHEFNNLEMMQAEGILDARKIIGLEIQYHNYGEGRSIDAKITHSPIHTYFSNRINVSGEEITWVEGVAGRLQKEVSTFEDQNALGKPNINLIISLALGASLAFLFVVVLDAYVKKSSSLGDLSTLFLAFFVLYSTTIYSLQIVLVRKLFPNVELQLGPDYQQRERISRSRAKWILVVLLTSIILPILIGVFILH
jgi:hypothetical protein